MEQQKLDEANNGLEQEAVARKKMMLRLTIGLIISILMMLLGLIFILVWYNSRPEPVSTYPYIPAPKNILRSRNRYELVQNMFLDLNDIGTLYSVISRDEIH